MTNTTNLPPLPEPSDYFYEWTTASGAHRSFSSWPWNGMKPEKAVAIYTTAQVEEIRRAAVLAERERCALVCEAESASHGGVAAGPMATERGKLVYESMAVGAKNCAAAIREGEKEAGE